jgi:hypothetical protein
MYVEFILFYFWNGTLIRITDMWNHSIWLLLDKSLEYHVLLLLIISLLKMKRTNTEQ